MAVDRIETLYHLTPHGWIDGSVDSMWKSHNRAVEPPADCVETWFMVWSSPGVNEKDRKALHEKFPHDLDTELMRYEVKLADEWLPYATAELDDSGALSFQLYDGSCGKAK